MSLTPPFHRALLILSVAVLPVLAHPFRLEVHETHRAAILALLAVLALLTLRRPRVRLAPDARPLLIAILLWAVALALSSLLALSPSRAILGDLIRRMGLGTHLALMAALLIGSAVDEDEDGWWFWRAGLLVALYVFLEAAGVLWPSPGVGRPPGPFGSATFTGGWLAVALVWIAASLPRRRRGLYFATLPVLALALVVTGSRGALVAALSGVVTVALVLAAMRRSRRIVLALAGAFALCVLMGIAALSGPRDGLLGRFTLDALQGPLIFRTALWSEAASIVRDWPRLVDVAGEPDRWADLRPVVGYGLEMVEVPHRLYVGDTVDGLTVGHRLDRAHNLWLDTAITTGAFGLLAQIALWIGIGWIGARRLGLSRWRALGLPLAAALVAGLLAWNGPFLPLACAFGALVGFCLALALRAFDPVAPSAQIDRRTLIALGVLAVHLVDLQFSFTTVATAWPAWLALGLLVTSRVPAPTPQSPARNHAWIWPALVGLFLLRFLIAEQARVVAVVVLLGAPLGLAALSGGLPRPRHLILIAVAWGAGLLGALLRDPWLAVLWDALALAASLYLLASPPSFRLNPRAVARPAVALLAVGIILARDLAADSHLQAGLAAASPDVALEETLRAAQLKPWDDRALAAAANNALVTAFVAPDTVDPNRLRFAEMLFRRAAALNGYDAALALQLGVIEANWALLAEFETHAREADRYFARAAALWPREEGVWREWARFTLAVMDDPLQAQVYLQRALALNPRDPASLDLRSQIERAMAASE